MAFFNTRTICIITIHPKGKEENGKKKEVLMTKKLKRPHTFNESITVSSLLQASFQRIGGLLACEFLLGCLERAVFNVKT